MPIEKLFENEYLVAINKPSGLVVHYDGKTEEPNVCDWVLENYPEAQHVGEPIHHPNGKTILRPGIVHRIDRETSGVLIIAKTQESFEHLKTEFQERKVHKTYNAFVYGHFKEKEGTIDRQIGKSKKDFRRWTAQRGARGKLRDAVTQYRAVKEGFAQDERVSFIEAYPRTGRTHQIRVHMKAIHKEVVCDKLYAPKKPCLLGLGRLALHARLIKFVGIDGALHEVEAPLPEDFQLALEGLTTIE